MQFLKNFFNNFVKKNEMECKPAKKVAFTSEFKSKKIN